MYMQLLVYALKTFTNMYRLGIRDYNLISKMAASFAKSMGFWNKESPKPVTCSLPVIPSWIQCDVLRGARRVLLECVQCLSQHQGLRAEFSVLSRLVYMKHGQLRREKSFQGLKQIKICLKKFLTKGLDRSMKEMMTHFEDVVVQEGVRVYLPSRQMWQHLLTEVLGATALLTCTASRCATFFVHVHRHLAAGMLIPTNMVFLSMLSRIWACCQALTIDLQSWYQLLQPVMEVLKPTEVPWLPEGESLPADLAEWLKEQGFRSGLSKQAKDISEDDMLASLMSKYQLQGKTGEEEVGPLSLDITMPATEEEDFGDPVHAREIEMRTGEENPDQMPGKKTNLKEKIKMAPSIHSLQRILRNFHKKHPGVASKEKILECSTLLANLQSRAEVLERKGKQDRVQNLLAVGRKKLRAFFKWVASHNTVGTVSNQGASSLSCKKMNKRNRAGKHTGEDQSTNRGEQNSKNTRVSLRKTVKNHSFSDANSRKKQKKNHKSGTKVSQKKRGPETDKFEVRRKKNDLVNNKVKAVQVNPKKARNV